MSTDNSFSIENFSLCSSQSSKRTVSSKNISNTTSKTKISDSGTDMKSNTTSNIKKEFMANKRINALRDLKLDAKSNLQVPVKDVPSNNKETNTSSISWIKNLRALILHVGHSFWRKR